MRWFQFTVEEFEATNNPKNGSIIVMKRVHYRPNCDRETAMECIEHEGGKVCRDQFVLDEEAFKALNIPSTVCRHREYYDVADNLRCIMEEAEEGYKILDKYKKPKGSPVLPMSPRFSSTASIDTTQIKLDTN
jgi:hypothetical protein